MKTKIKIFIGSIFVLLNLFVFNFYDAHAVANCVLTVDDVEVTSGDIVNSSDSVYSCTGVEDPVECGETATSSCTYFQYNFYGDNLDDFCSVPVVFNSSFNSSVDFDSLVDTGVYIRLKADNSNSVGSDNCFNSGLQTSGLIGTSVGGFNLIDPVSISLQIVNLTADITDDLGLIIPYILSFAGIVISFFLGWRILRRFIIR